ncbi:MAG: hypothetical protein WCL04_06055 [Verrucomicrobiota bacterium]
MIRRYLALLALLPAALFGAAPILFNGVLVDGNGKIQVFLRNTDTANTKLLPIGGKFGGYIVEACNNPTGTKPEIVLASITNPEVKQIVRLQQVSVGVSTSPTPANTVNAAPVPTTPLPPGANADPAAVMSAIESQAAALSKAATAAPPPPAPAQ